MIEIDYDREHFPSGFLWNIPKGHPDLQWFWEKGKHPDRPIMTSVIQIAMQQIGYN